ncbi:RND efflux system, membrane fusion protein [Citrifermentans bremense]|uniref:RND efflux system, membrane fusion protein n=1 Tax=Citrifermentans bremense TaxID=60035 RepID=A0A6S6M509_9BACT|nr:efflux RND transporter periplasmic adaptor subunit [Citrifermentans bremense]BCG48750.1 RND efflux system, membrane fusion protein [Citrifermentans bremense]
MRQVKAAIPGVLVATLLCGVSLAFSGCGKKEKLEPATSTPTVSVIVVQPQDGPVVLEKIAQTQSSQMVNIQARVNGFLDRCLYTEGAIVDKGKVLFQIDPKPFQVQVAQARAALSRQEAGLKAARLNLERTKPLAQVNALSKKDLDDATSRFQSEAAAVEQAKAQLDSALLNLSYATITSPIRGITSAAQQAEGTYISSQNSLLTTVSALSPIWVNFSMSENEMLKYRQEIASGRLRVPSGEKFLVEVVLPDGTPLPQTGRITFAAPSYNPQTGTFLIRASLDNRNGHLLPNQFVRVRLKGALRPQAILLPQRAVQQGAQGHFVWVVGRDDTVEQRPVTVGEWRGNEWYISEGIKGGERVVVDGTLALSAGSKVQLQRYSSGRPNAGPGARGR